MESYRSERTINLKDLCVKLGRFWIWIAGTAAAGAILLPLWRFYKSRKAYKAELAVFEQGVKDAVEPTPVSFPFSYIVIGLILGAILAVFVILLREFLSGKVKCPAELDKPKDAQLLAVFKRSEDTKAETFVKKVIRAQTANPIEKEAELLYSRLTTTCRNQEIAHLIFAGDAAESEAELLLDTAEKLRLDGVPADCIGDILGDPQAIRQLNAGDGVVLVVKTGETTYRNLDEEIAQCRRQNTKLVGFVAIE